MINNVISRVTTHCYINTLDDIFVGYEIWGYLSVIPMFSSPFNVSEFKGVLDKSGGFWRPANLTMVGLEVLLGGSNAR